MGVKFDRQLTAIHVTERASKQWRSHAERYWPTLVKGLKSRGWYSYQTRHNFSVFLEKLMERPGEVSPFLLPRIDALDAQSIERLREHIGDRNRYRIGSKSILAELFAKLDGKATKTDYAFRAIGEYTAAQIEKLPAARKKQFLAAAKKYLPGKHGTPRAFFTALGREIDQRADGLTATLYGIALAEKPKKRIYEMWTFEVDNGTVFRSGQAKPSGVHMIQGGFQAEKPTPELRALAGDLQRVVPF